MINLLPEAQKSCCPLISDGSGFYPSHHRRRRFHSCSLSLAGAQNSSHLWLFPRGVNSTRAARPRWARSFGGGRSAGRVRGSAFSADAAADFPGAWDPRRLSFRKPPCSPVGARCRTPALSAASRRPGPAPLRIPSSPCGENARVLVPPSAALQAPARPLPSGLAESASPRVLV